MTAVGFVIGYLLLAVATGIAFRVASRGEVDRSGCAAIGLLWPASFLLLIGILACGVLVAFGRGWTQAGWTEALDDSPPVCNECGLFTADVTIAGIPQARCSCGEACPAAPPAALCVCQRTFVYGPEESAEKRGRS